MVALLWVIAGAAGLSALVGLLDLLSLSRPGATVFQQISARVDVGFSLLVFVCASGFASVLRRMDDKAAAATAATKPKLHETFRGVRIMRLGDVYSATVGGEPLESHSPEALRARIEAARGVA